MGSHLVDLSYQMCLDLLRRGDLGRVAVCTPAGPRIFPVNYTVIDDCLVFRTAPYTVLGTHANGSRLSVEVDELDHDRRRGWSVVALGRATVVEDPEEIDAIRSQADPSPWAGGSRPLYVRVRLEELTGRSIGDPASAESGPYTSPVR
jgi:nitroimidazol reductase NimA-like FMN-containing flavoprotein (pyridoxamine 5'-phosphate oxidase superfamily)